MLRLKRNFKAFVKLLMQACINILTMNTMTKRVHSVLKQVNLYCIINQLLFSFLAFYIRGWDDKMIKQVRIQQKSKKFLYHNRWRFGV